MAAEPRVAFMNRELTDRDLMANPLRISLANAFKEPLFVDLNERWGDP
jgi:hypothetical protein